MMSKRSILNRVISIILVFTILMMLVSCSSSPPTPSISNADPQLITENIEIESVIDEDVLHEFITEEIYLKELVVVEGKVTELLLEEEQISEVLTCKTIYVSQDHIDDFAENSQSKQVFGEGIELKPLLTKIAVGTGVIVTLVILKKANLPEPIASMVVSAADQSLQFAIGGQAIGSISGGLTGATDELDETGRMSAVIAVATSIFGLILASISLIAAIPSGGSTTITAAAGIKLVVAGVLTLTAAAGTIKSGRDAIKTFTATDAVDIDWDNVDWEKVGVSAAQNSIEGQADGYMWGAIIGAVRGGAEGLDFYQKYNTPYTEYNARLMQTPKDGNGGKWSGERGESDFILDEPIICEDGTKITKVTYKNAVPDFSKFQKAQVKISKMSNSRYQNFKKADTALAEYWTKIKHNGKAWTARDVEAYRKANNLTWHEMSNMESMQLVPSEVNQTFTHYGGVAEYNAMIGQEGEVEFD